MTVPMPLAKSLEVADYLQISTDTLARLRGQGDGPRYVKIGANVRYAWRDVDAYLVGCQRTTSRPVI